MEECLQSVRLVPVKGATEARLKIEKILTIYGTLQSKCDIDMPYLTRCRKGQRIISSESCICSEGKYQECHKKL